MNSFVKRPHYVAQEARAKHGFLMTQHLGKMFDSVTETNFKLTKYTNPPFL